MATPAVQLALQHRQDVLAKRWVELDNLRMAGLQKLEPMVLDEAKQAHKKVDEEINKYVDSVEE